MKGVHFRVKLSPHEVAAVVAAFILILVIGIVTWTSDVVNLNAFGLYLMLIGAMMMGFGLTKTNDELLELTGHYQKLRAQELISRFTRDRFFVILGVFLLTLGILAQIVGLQFY